jgi:hypothetical protein
MTVDVREPTADTVVMSSSEAPDAGTDIRHRPSIDRLFRYGGFGTSTELGAIDAITPAEMVQGTAALLASPTDANVEPATGWVGQFDSHLQETYHVPGQPTFTFIASDVDTWAVTFDSLDGGSVAGRDDIDLPRAWTDRAVALRRASRNLRVLGGSVVVQASPDADAGPPGALTGEPEMIVEVDAYFAPRKSRVVPGVVVRRRRARFETAFDEELQEPLTDFDEG